MAMITVTSTCKTSRSQTLSSESNNNNLRDVSFSSYLNGAEENFVRELAESSQKLSPTLASQEKQHYLGKKEEDEEIGVFSAEKYFNGAMDDSPRLAKVSTRKHEYVNDEQIKVASVKPKIQSGTPSVRSESSWNSRSALLQCVLRNPSRKQTKKGKSFLAGLRCKCSCSDKESVDINEHIGETSFKKSANCSIIQGRAIANEPIKPGQLIETVQVDESAGLAKDDLGLNRENCFSFPTMNSRTESLPIKIHSEEEEEIKPRKSKEVTGCSGLEKRNKSLSLEKRLSMLSWDVAPRLEKFEYSASPGGESYNDAASDASSDLFEIDSISGKANPFLARQVSDATSDCATPTACYAPSEGSIEWSIVTASAADFSVMSDFEELRQPTTATSPVKSFSVTSNGKTTTITELPKRRPSISLGCKSNKAVRVAGDAYRTNEKATNYDARIRCVSDSLTPITKFQTEAKLIGFDSRQRQHAYSLASTGAFPRSHSFRPSNVLYIR